MTDALVRIGALIAIFASVFVISQFALNSLWAKRAHTAAVNKRLQLLRQGSSREQVMAQLRKNAPRIYANLPPFLSKHYENLQRTIMASALPVTPLQGLLLMAGAFLLIIAILLILTASWGFEISSGILVLTVALSFCVAFALPMLALSFVGQRRRKRIEQQFPVALDIFVRALRAGHPIASAIDLLTKEMEDPIGSEFGMVSDEVAYGAELTDALAAMAERWNLDDMRMFVVSLSVQNETGGNLAEILENLADVIRARASLYMKVRALSSEGRMTGWMLTLLPIIAFVGLFTVNPEFYLSVAQDSMFIIGAIILAVMYLLGFVMIRRMIDIKV
jgi:tight adherence protein B